MPQSRPADDEGSVRYVAQADGRVRREPVAADRSGFGCLWLRGTETVEASRIYPPRDVTLSRKRAVELLEQHLHQACLYIWLAPDTLQRRAEVLSAHDSVDLDQQASLGVQARVAAQNIEETHLCHRHAPSSRMPPASSRSGPVRVIFEVPLSL